MVFNLVLLSIQILRTSCLVGVETFRVMFLMTHGTFDLLDFDWILLTSFLMLPDTGRGVLAMTEGALDLGMLFWIWILRTSCLVSQDIAFIVVSATVFARHLLSLCHWQR